MRAKIAISLLSINIVVIALISLSIISGFFQINLRWKSYLTEDVISTLSMYLNERYPELNDVSELQDDQLAEISDEALKDHRGKLRALTIYSPNCGFVYSIDIPDSLDEAPDKPPKPELIRWASEIWNRFSSWRRSEWGALRGTENKIIGMINIQTYPLMGMKYTNYFDRIITDALFIGIIIASVISLLVSWFLSRNLSKNSHLFAAQLARLARGDRDINFTGGTTLELQSSAEAAGRLQSQLQYNEAAQLQKLQDIVHDLKTPVSALSIQFDAISDGVLTIDEKRINLLSSEFDRIQEIISELSHYTRISSDDYIPQPDVVDLNTLIEEAIERFSLQTGQKNQELVFEKPTSPSLVEIDKTGLMRVINNLTANAMNNAPDESKIVFSITEARNIIDRARLYIIAVENSGRIDNSELPLIFDRLYRSKKSGYQGNGLGLAISKSIIEKNKGTISVQNTSRGTVVFKLELPAYGMMPPRSLSKPQSSSDILR